MPGSHGSLTKAGKVRNLTPKVPRTGVNSRSKKIPRVRNRNLYVKRIIAQAYGGQANSMAAQKHARKIGQQNRRK
ncbi:MAG: 30S ribosomal protein S30e [Promethearchaeota archaeon]|jgi:small subunit ribosomal protein S30e